MTKQEALNNIKEALPNPFAFKKELELLEEKTPTLEEVIKEWEELGYVWKDKGEFYILTKYSSNKVSIRDLILIWKDCKVYEKRNEDFTLQEHLLLTKTFKALGWFE